MEINSYVMLEYVAVLQLLFDKVILSHNTATIPVLVDPSHQHQQKYHYNHDKNHSSENNIEKSIILLWQLSIITKRIDLYDLICDVVGKSTLKGMTRWMEIGDDVMSSRYDDAIHKYHHLCYDEYSDNVVLGTSVNQTFDNTSSSSSISSSSSLIDVISPEVYIQRWIHHMILIAAVNTINTTLSNQAVNNIILLSQNYPAIHSMTELECNFYLHVQLRQLQQQEQQQQQNNCTSSDDIRLLDNSGTIETSLSNIYTYMMVNKYSLSSENEYLLKRLTTVSISTDHVSSSSAASSSSLSSPCWYLEHHVALPELNIIHINVV